MRARARRARAPRSSPHAPARAALAESDEEEAEEADAEEEEEAGDTAALNVWALRGSLAGAKARDDSANGREYSTEPPAAVTAAGAELEWLAAFHAAFKPRLASSPQDAIVSGLVVKKRRKTSIAVNKSGITGLNENAEGVLSNLVYANIRCYFFMPDDDGEAIVRAALAGEGFTFADDDFEDWWAAKGHKQARAKAKSARYSVVDNVKEAIWNKHGAAALGRCAAHH